MQILQNDTTTVFGSESLNNVLYFTGKEWEQETGTYYFGARRYDPTIGQWLGRDPARQFESPYVYGLSNPLGGFDFDGRVWRTRGYHYKNIWGDIFYNAIGVLSSGQKAGKGTNAGNTFGLSTDNKFDLRIQVVEQIWEYDENASDEINNRHEIGTMRVFERVKAPMNVVNKDFLLQYGYHESTPVLAQTPNITNETLYDWNPTVHDYNYNEFQESVAPTYSPEGYGPKGTGRVTIGEPNIERSN